MSYTIYNAHPSIPLMANVPHSSDLVPSVVEDQFIIDSSELEAQQKLLVDWFTDQLYYPVIEQGGCMIRHDVSRFVVDCERFEDDTKEVMTSRGMGVIYSHGCQRQRVRKELLPKQRNQLICDYYTPYHNELTRKAKSILDRFGTCIILDCHSYPCEPLPYEIDGTAERSEFVLGTDPFHTAPQVISAVEKVVRSHGYSFAVDRPFAGTYVPLPFYRDERIVALMLEIRRDTYMDESSTSRTKDFLKVQACISSIVNAVMSATEVSFSDSAEFNLPAEMQK